MSTPAQVQNFEAAALNIGRSFNPRDADVRVNKRGQFVRVNGEGQALSAINSLLPEDAWIELDRVILEASRYPLRLVTDLRSRGLVTPLGSVGTLEARWYTQSAITKATISMTGRGRAERDLPELLPDAVPVPVISKEFSIDWRTLAASQRLGDPLDMTTAAEATRVVAEAIEDLAVNGSTAVTLNSRPVYGIRNHPKRKTDTASNFGGGDWGTQANVLNTVRGMINAANLQNNYGPFVLYVSQTQYNEAALNRYTDGSGETPLDTLRKLPMIQDVQPLPPNVMADGEAEMIQPTREYIELAEAMSIQAREWTSGDGLESMFKVMAIITPKIKARQGNETGIVHVTGI